MASPTSPEPSPSGAAPRLTVDPARCTWEELDGETLVIDTTTGTLVVLRGLATDVWRGLTGGASTVPALVDEATRRYGADVGGALAGVLDTMLPLLSVSDGHDMSDAAVPWPQAAEPPAIERFDEIAEILTLDPIHDVEPGAGWPFEPGTGPS